MTIEQLCEEEFIGSIPETSEDGSDNKDNRAMLWNGDGGWKFIYVPSGGYSSSGENSKKRAIEKAMEIWPKVRFFVFEDRVDLLLWMADIDLT